MSENFEKAKGLPCPRCGREALRLINGVCLRCAREAEEKSDAEMEKRARLRELWQVTRDRRRLWQRQPNVVKR